MKKITKSIFLILLLCGFSFAQAQTTVSGTVTEEDGSAVYGAVVRVVGVTGLGTVTGNNGGYTLTVNQSVPFTLSVSYSGLKTEEKQVTAGNTTVDFTLDRKSVV